MGRLHPFNNGTSLRICPAPCFYTLCLLSCPLVNTVDFLDDKGIQYSEFHVAEFRLIAERHDFVIKSEVERENASPSTTSIGRAGTVGASRLPRRAGRASSIVSTGPLVTSLSALRW
jgi:hypothetical protein